MNANWGGGGIFTYSGSARLTSFEINFNSKETSRAEPEYMNIHPPPPNWRSSDGPGQAWFIRRYIYIGGPVRGGPNVASLSFKACYVAI